MAKPVECCCYGLGTGAPAVGGSSSSSSRFARSVSNSRICFSFCLRLWRFTNCSVSRRRLSASNSIWRCQIRAACLSYSSISTSESIAAGGSSSGSWDEGIAVPHEGQAFLSGLTGASHLLQNLAGWDMVHFFYHGPQFTHLVERVDYRHALSIFHITSTYGVIPVDSPCASRVLHPALPRMWCQ